MKHTAREIEDWCVDYLAKLLDIPPAKIDPKVDFDRYGLDSSLAVSLVIALEEFVGTELSPSVLFEHPNIAALAQRLSDPGLGAGR